jgi:hypothetical protein
MLKLSVSKGLPRALAAFVLLAAFLAGLDASAQTDEERAGARAAAQEGATAFQEKRWADAIDLFTRAESLVHSPMHQLFMARAHANLNKLINARELYNKVIREPLATNAPKAFQNAQKEAQKELDELEPRIPYVTVQVEGAGAQTVSVTQNGAAIPPALIGVPRPVDPGEHEFQALTESLASRPQKVVVAERARQTVSLKLEPRSAVAAPPVAATPTATPETTGPAPGPTATPGVPGDQQPPADTGSRKTVLLVGSIAGFAVGVGGIAMGIAFSGKASDKDEEADQLCQSRADAQGRCDERDKPQIDALDDDASSARTMATVGYVVGGVGIAAGGTLLVMYLGSKPKAAALGPRLEPVIGLGSLGVKGTF